MELDRKLLYEDPLLTWLLLKPLEPPLPKPPRADARSERVASARPTTNRVEAA
jgi:hypothetical protein